MKLYIDLKPLSMLSRWSHQRRVLTPGTLRRKATSLGCSTRLQEDITVHAVTKRSRVKRDWVVTTKDTRDNLATGVKLVLEGSLVQQITMIIWQSMRVEHFLAIIAKKDSPRTEVLSNIVSSIYELSWDWCVSLLEHFYHWRQGNVFTPVCDSVHRGGLCQTPP